MKIFDFWYRFFYFTFFFWFDLLTSREIKTVTCDKERGSKHQTIKRVKVNSIFILKFRYGIYAVKKIYWKMSIMPLLTRLDYSFDSDWGQANVPEVFFSVFQEIFVWDKVIILLNPLQFLNNVILENWWKVCLVFYWNSSPNGVKKGKKNVLRMISIDVEIQFLTNQLNNRF